MPDLWMDVDAALTEVPVNIFPLIDDTDFKTREVAIAYNQAGMDLVWNFVTTAGATTQTAVTPTTGGDYDWAHQGDGMYTIEIPASGGASINNDTEGFGWFTGICTGVLAWRGPIIGFRAAGLNNLLIDSAHSATRGLAGTALPDAAADAAGGVPISDAGGLDLDLYIKSGVTLIGTANAGDTTVKITLTGGVATDNYYNGQLVIITGGTGAGQSRTILNYVAAGTVATPTRDWAVAPDGTSTFVVIGADVPSILEAGVAQAGAAATITLDATASTTVDIYKNNFVAITGGTGAGQTRLIGAYSAARVATVLPNWTTNPDNTSIYQVLPAARVDIQGWAGNVVTGDGDWAALKAETAAIVAALTTVDTVVDAIKAVTDLLNAAQAEPTGVPAVNETPLDKLAYLFMSLRNKLTITATAKTFCDDDGNAEWKKTLEDDGTTYSETEGVAP
jgi:hypothetical protein